MAAYTLHLALTAESDSEALRIADALGALVGELHLTDANDWGEHVALECACVGRPACYQQFIDGPRVEVDVPVCDSEFVSIGAGRRVCRAHARAHEEARVAGLRLTR